MSTDESTIQKLVAMAASLLKKPLMLTVQQAMCAANTHKAQTRDRERSVAAASSDHNNDDGSGGGDGQLQKTKGGNKC